MVLGDCLSGNFARREDQSTPGRNETALQEKVLSQAITLRQDHQQGGCEVGQAHAGQGSSQKIHDGEGGREAVEHCEAEQERECF